MSTVAAGGDDEQFADPLPYLERFNDALEQHGQAPLFSEQASAPDAYDLNRSFDFSGWEQVKEPTEFPDGMFDVPDSRIRVIGEHDGKLLHACYEKVLLPIEGATYTEILARAQAPLPFKWRVTYRVHSWDACTCANAKLTHVRGEGYSELYHQDCGRWRKTKADGPMDEHVASLSIAPPDEMYNGYYPTIPGNDIAHLRPEAAGMDQFREGRVLMGSTQLDNQDRVIDGRHAIRGGTEIRGGRREHREKTKGMIAWDNGTQKDLDRMKAEKAAARKASIRTSVEKALAKAPPSLGWE